MEIIFKHVEGLKNTHNAGGRVVRSWRVMSDGTLQRTNNASKYVQPFKSDKLPQEVIDFAKANGVTLSGFRLQNQSHPA